MEIEIKGHSGCLIEIRREDRNLYVYKSCSDKKYLQRLTRQALKQQEAAKKLRLHIKVPQILNIEESENSVVIKMPYVYSNNYIDFFEYAGAEDIDFFINELIGFIESEIKESSFQNYYKAAEFNHKFNDVANKISLNPHLASYYPTIGSILKKADRINETIQIYTIPIGKCHGDLTFSNILFAGNNFFLIDFLDSFVESPLMDIVKVRQDSHHLWSTLMYNKDFDKVRIGMISLKIDLAIDTHFNQYQWYRDFYYPFQLLNFLRILQYAHEPRVIEFLILQIQQIFAEYESYRSHSQR